MTNLDNINHHREMVDKEITSIRQDIFQLGNKISNLQDSLLEENKPAQAYKVAQMRSTLAKYYLDLHDIRKSL